MEPRHAFVMIIVLSFVLPTTTGAPNLDAGLGDDAGDSPGMASQLAGPGNYEAVLGMPSDTDWFYFEDPDTVCSLATVRGPELGTVRLTGDGSEAGAVAALARDGVDLAIANTGGATYLEVATYRQEAKGGGKGGPGYEFTLDAVTVPGLGTGDAATGTDAPQTASDGILVEAGCLGGKLDVQTDTEDWFRFEAVEGQTAFLSLESLNGLPVSLTVLDPAGDAVATLEPGDVEAVDIDAAGTWSVGLEVASGLSLTSDDGAYVLGLTLVPKDPPPSNPCRPACSTS